MTAKPSIVTRDITELSRGTGNIYKSLNVISKRARQISSNVREELSGKLAEFASTVDNLEEIFENREQIEISKFYEKMSKPTIVAIEEFSEGKILVREAMSEEGGIEI